MSVSRELILREVRRTAEENAGKPLGRMAFEKQTGIKESDWRGRYWARWNDVLREAGYRPNALVQRLSDDEVLSQLAALCLELGRIPTSPEMRLWKRTNPCFPNDKVYLRFGPREAVLRKLHAWADGRPQYRGVLPLIDALDLAPEKEQFPEEPVAVEFGAVYLLRSGRYYKVGRSNAAGRREREVALQLPEKATMVHVIRTDDPPGFEAYWHSRFAERRKNGEWFALTPADVSAFRRRKFM